MEVATAAPICYSHAASLQQESLDQAPLGVSPTFGACTCRAGQSMLSYTFLASIRSQPGAFCAIMPAPWFCGCCQYQSLQRSRAPWASCAKRCILLLNHSFCMLCVCVCMSTACWRTHCMTWLIQRHDASTLQRGRPQHHTGCKVHSVQSAACGRWTHHLCSR